MFKADARVRKAAFVIAAGAVPVDVTIRLGRKRYDVHVDAAGVEQVTASMPSGLTYEKEVEGVALWHVRITTRGGFTPIFYDPAAGDARYLGARIKPMLVARP